MRKRAFKKIIIVIFLYAVLIHGILSYYSIPYIRSAFVAGMVLSVLNIYSFVIIVRGMLSEVSSGGGGRAVTFLLKLVVLFSIFFLCYYLGGSLALYSCLGGYMVTLPLMIVLGYDWQL